MCVCVFLQRVNQSSDSTSEVCEELRLMRTILGRLECSFAKQEAKLDRLLNRMTAPTPAPQTPQCTPQTSAHNFTTPFSTNSISSGEFSASPIVSRQQEMPIDLHLFDVPTQRNAFPELTDSGLWK